MWIGSSKQKNIKILEFSVTKHPIKILGTYLSHNPDKNINANFYVKIRKMSTKLNLWRARKLTLYGKSLLAKTLGASQLIYTASMICVPDTVINNVQGHLFSFLWNNRKDKIKRKVMYQPLSEGGTNFIDFRTMVKSLRLAWIQRLLTNSYDAWKAIPNYFFNKYGGLAFLLKCNFDSVKLDKNLPLFYRELLDYFQELTNNSQYITNDLILWNNKNITVDKKSLFWKSWFDRGIYFIGDLLNSAGKFLTLDEFQKKFDFKVSYLNYFQLIAAIPQELKRKALASPTPDLFSIPLEFQQLNDRTLLLPKMRCKHYYKMFIEKNNIEPTAVKSWKKLFPYFTDWKRSFKEIYESSRDNKLRQFSFKVLHRIIPTRKELKKYKLVTDDICSLCPNPDSIEHTFLHCTESVNFYTKTLSWFNSYYNTRIHLPHEHIVLNTFKDVFPPTLSNPLKHRLGLLILFQTKYLYTCKNLSKRPDLEEFLSKLHQQYRIENCGL